MNAKVILTAERGLGKREAFVFETPTFCILGRAEDCALHVPNDAAHQSVSRHHCLIGVVPPDIWICDLGSRNGTYVNAVDIGHRPQKMPAKGHSHPHVTHTLEDGDAIQTGNVLLTVHVYAEKESETELRPK